MPDQVKKDGGPAFPSNWMDTDSCGEVKPRESHPGMTLRDYFAAAALSCAIRGYGYGSPVDHPGIAKGAYEIADAMLSEREKPEVKNP